METVDLAVIGGGSGGMAAAKEAAKFGKSVVLFDFVTPSTQGTTWGLGGTCVNVGCVPKKLMHYAASIGPIIHHDAPTVGWNIISNHNNSSDDSQLSNASINWHTLVQTVQKHVKSLNFSYRTSLRSANVKYINATAKLVSENKIIYTYQKQEKTVFAKHILLATGGRPDVPDNIPGAVELAITSDDLFSLKKPPGKTLVVGASYIALECAGFLTELGFDVTVAVRSILLRGFDQQCAEKVGSLMEEVGTKFLKKCTLKSLTKTADGKILVAFHGGFPSDEFDTVLFAIGRKADTKRLGLEEIGVKLESNNKIRALDEQTEVPNIYAVGDILYGRLELTPVAIKAGELLAGRLFGGNDTKMDYTFVPTTIFTPYEYGCCGYSEEAAQEEFGEDDVECYLSEFTSLTLSAMHRTKVESLRGDEFDDMMSPTCLAKLVCVKSMGEKVVGFHFVGPNAGEITQGMALAVKMGVKKKDFDSVVGIHPTDAESFMALSVKKSSGESWIASGGCGGGKCG